MDKGKLETLGMEYQALKATIDAAEERQSEIKAALRDILPPYNPSLKPEEQRWQAGPTAFMWVKGRETTTLDKTKLRTKLALAGVALSVIDEAFKAASTEKQGYETLRITGADPNLEED